MITDELATAVAAMVCAEDTTEGFLVVAGNAPAPVRDSVKKQLLKQQTHPMAVFDGAEFLPTSFLEIKPTLEKLMPPERFKGVVVDPVGGSLFFSFRLLRGDEKHRLSLRLRAPVMGEVRTTIVPPNGQAQHRVGVFAHPRHEPFVGNVEFAGPYPSTTIIFEPDAKHALATDYARALRVSCAAAKRDPREWAVLFGEKDSPRIRFSTDPSGVLATFRLRDLPPGAARRKALAHWVKEHARKLRPPSERESVLVREHVRGERKFTWDGFRCEIIPGEDA